jgi:hypothetical protein
VPGGRWSAGPLVVRSSKSGAHSPTAGEPNGDTGSAAPGIGEPENEEPIRDEGECPSDAGRQSLSTRMGRRAHIRAVPSHLCDSARIRQLCVGDTEAEVVTQLFEAHRSGYGL